MSSAAPVASFLPGTATSQPRSTGDLLRLMAQRPGGRRGLSASIALLLFAALVVIVTPLANRAGGAGGHSGRHHHSRAAAPARHHDATTPWQGAAGGSP